MTFSHDGNQFLMSFYGKARGAKTSAPLIYLNVLVLYSVFYSIIFLLIWISFGLILSGFFKTFLR